MPTTKFIGSLADSWTHCVTRRVVAPVVLLGLVLGLAGYPSLGWAQGGRAGGGAGGSGVTQVAEVVTLTGEVSRVTAGGQGAATALKVGSQLAVGDRVTTARKSRCTIRFADGSTADLSEKSELVIGKPLKKNRFSILLLLGRLLSKVTAMGAKNPDESAYEVTTATAVAGVRGTEFEVVASDDGTTVVSVADGKVAVLGLDQPELVLGAGEETIVLPAAVPGVVGFARKGSVKQPVKPNTARDVLRGGASAVSRDPVGYVDSRVSIIESQLQQLNSLRETGAGIERALRSAAAANDVAKADEAAATLRRLKQRARQLEAQATVNERVLRTWSEGGGAAAQEKSGALRAAAARATTRVDALTSEIAKAGEAIRRLGKGARAKTK